MKITHLLVAGLMMALFAACGDSSPEGKAAQGACDCAQPLIEMANKKADGEEIAQDKIVSEMATFGECMDKLKEEFGDKSDDPEFGKKVQEKMKEKCPEMEEAMKKLQG